VSAPSGGFSNVQISERFKKTRPNDGERKARRVFSKKDK